MSRVSHSVESQTVNLAQLEEENERLRRVVERDEEMDTERRSLLKCGVCFHIESAAAFVINSPCGHCVCQTVRLQIQLQVLPFFHSVFKGHVAFTVAAGDVFILPHSD